MSDTYKIKAVLDTADVKRGAQEIENELAQMGGGGGSQLPQSSLDDISLNTKSTESINAKITATEKLTDVTRKLGTEQKAAMILGGGTAVADLAGSFLKAAGMDTGAGMLTNAAGKAAQLGTMLAPLGPQAALIGAAAGGISGAVGSLVESMGSAQKALAEQAVQAKKDAAELRRATAKRKADEIVSRKQFEELAKSDPEAAKDFLTGIRKELETAMVYAKTGAPIEQDLRKTALYYPEETENVLRTGFQTDRKSLSPEQQDLHFALRDKTQLETNRDAAYAEGDFQRWVEIKDSLKYYSDKFPELMSRSTDQAGATSRVGDIENNDLFKSGELNPAKSGKAGGLGSVDAMQNIGLGIYSNPMKKSEELLKSIDGKLSVISRKPAGSTLL